MHRLTSGSPQDLRGGAGPPPPPDPPSAPQGPGEPGGRGRLARAGLLVLPAVVGAGVALGVVALTGNLGGDDGSGTVVVRAPAEVAVSADATPAPTAPAAGDGGGAIDLTTLIAGAAPAVARVEADAERLGSGFVIDEDRHLLTNAHVVGDADTVELTFADGTETPAKVVGRDESTDLAVLQAETIPARTAPIPLGRSGTVEVGAGVVVIGNPFGYERTATTGIVSGTERIIVSPNAFAVQNALQTDAAINQGNSGGPLMDLRGRAIGLVSQIATEDGDNDGVGFAVPMDTLRPVITSIIETGEPEHAWLGIQGGTLTPAEARAAGAPGRGVAVTGVDDRGPAKRAGLIADADGDEPGPEADVIIAVDGVAVSDMADVSRAVSAHRVGDVVTLTIVRDGGREDVTATLADRPSDIGRVQGRP